MSSQPSLPPSIKAARLAQMAGLLVALGVTGCKLIDQTAFAPAPSALPTLTPATPRLESRAPLLTIDQGTRLTDYQALLRYAVRQAEERDPAVQFDVLGVVPDKGSPAEQVKAAEQASQAATAVARSIVGDGVDAARVHLGARANPDVSQPQVRVYVR